MVKTLACPRYQSVWMTDPDGFCIVGSFILWTCTITALNFYCLLLITLMIPPDLGRNWCDFGKSMAQKGLVMHQTVRPSFAARLDMRLTDYEDCRQFN